MRLGQRSTRIRSGAGCQLKQVLLRPLAGWLTAAALIAPAFAQRAAPITVGPERIVCNASFCEMGSGARPQERVRVIVSNLPANEIKRLRNCTGVSAPCIVTVGGTEQGDRLKVMASSIHWQEPEGQQSVGRD